MDWLTDLTPFVSDHCWQFVLLAPKAPVGVVIRRGPSKWWHLTLWDTRQDRFTSGQWFHGSMYPRKCDLAPNGKLFSYFVGKFRRREEERGYDSTWVAVSRPPYFRALALWPVGDTWGGHTMFLEDGSFHEGPSSRPSAGATAGCAAFHFEPRLSFPVGFPVGARGGGRSGCPMT